MELAAKTVDRSSILQRNCYKVEQDSSSADAPWTSDVARCPGYVAEVVVMVGSAVDFGPDFVIVAAVIAALLVVTLDLVLAVQIAAAVGGYLPVDPVASQSGDVRGEVEHTPREVEHCVQSSRSDRYASFHL